MSHATPDQDIADALRGLVLDLYGKSIEVAQSTDESAEGGISPGADWMAWINKQIRSADATYVLLTPHSVLRPWVMWESGAAAGVALATETKKPIVPITFGVADKDIPSPLAGRQRIKGDSGGAKIGIRRLVQDLNRLLSEPLTGKVFDASVKSLVPPYLVAVKQVLADAPPGKRLLEPIPAIVTPQHLEGFWVTSFDFVSRAGKTRHHADIVHLRPVSESRMVVRNTKPEPRTEDHEVPFCNQIDADIANRHLVGHWKNVTDERYFGSIHLAILQRENVMDGYYSSFASDVEVGFGSWRWVRISPESIENVDLGKLRLKDPKEISNLVKTRSHHRKALDLGEVAEPE